MRRIAPEKAAIKAAIATCYADLHRLEIVLAERKALVQEAIHQEWDCRDEVRAVKAALADHADALAAFEATERMARRAAKVAA